MAERQNVYDILETYIEKLKKEIEGILGAKMIDCPHIGRYCTFGKVVLFQEFLKFCCHILLNFKNLRKQNYFTKKGLQVILNGIQCLKNGFDFLNNAFLFR